MTLKQPDIKYAFDLLTRLEVVRVGGERLCDMLLLGRYNAWQFQRHLIFARDLHPFSESYELDEATRRIIRDERFPFRAIPSYIAVLLISLAYALLLMITRRKLLVFSVDKVSSRERCDHRIESLYQFLRERNIRHVEIFHTPLGRKMLRNIVSRGRGGIYLEAIDTIFYMFDGVLSLFARRRAPALDLGAFTGAERPAIELIIDKCLRAMRLSTWRIKVFRVLLRLSAVQAIWLIDDTRYFYELLLAARLENVRTYAFQHGHYSKYSVGLLKSPALSGEFISPDALFVKSAYWRDELIRLGTHVAPERIKVAQVKNASKRDASEHAQGDRGERIGVVIAYETGGYKQEIARYMKKLLACKNVRVYFKARPDVDATLQISEYGFSPDDPSLEIIRDIGEVQEEAYAVAGSYSTYLYEMVTAGVPVAYLETRSDYGEGLIESGLADKVGLDGDLCAAMERVARTPRSVLSARAERLAGEDTTTYDEALARIAERDGIMGRL